MKISELKKTIREIPDYPKKGILFYDITTLLQNAKAFQKTIDTIANRYVNKKFDSIVCIDSRGFIIGAALAYKLCKGLVLVRKKGKLPYRTIRASYELEYGTDEIEVHEDAVKKGQKVIIVDDLLATGGTAKATIELVNKSGGIVKECAFIIELTELSGRKKLAGVPVFSLLKY